MFGDPDVVGTKESSIKLGGTYSGKINKTGSGWGGWDQEVTSLSAGDTLKDYLVNIS